MAQAASHHLKVDPSGKLWRFTKYLLTEAQSGPCDTIFRVDLKAKVLLKSVFKEHSFRDNPVILFNTLK